MMTKTMIKTLRRELAMQPNPHSMQLSKKLVREIINLLKEAA